MTYTHLGIDSTKSHTQVLCNEQRFLNTVLQSSLKKCRGFSTKQQSISIFSGVLALKKNKIYSIEIKQRKVPKKYNIFIGTRKLKKIKHFQRLFFQFFNFNV